mgnify:CR=1 FL=1
MLMRRIKQIDYEKWFFIIVLIMLGSCRSIVSIDGKAANGKGGAVVISDDKKLYYLENMDYWGENMYNQRINVKGRLEVNKYKMKPIKDSMWIDQTPGIYLIHKPKITVIDTL